MTTDLIRLETLSAALQISNVAVRKRFAKGELPTPDATVDLRKLMRRTTVPGTQEAMAWRLETLKRWNPAVATRCAAIQRALAEYPLTDQAA